jgi:hypothetical protein
MLVANALVSANIDGGFHVPPNFQGGAPLLLPHHLPPFGRQRIREGQSALAGWRSFLLATIVCMGSIVLATVSKKINQKKSKQIKIHIVLDVNHLTFGAATTLFKIKYQPRTQHTK